MSKIYPRYIHIKPRISRLQSHERIRVSADYIVLICGYQRSLTGEVSKTRHLKSLSPQPFARQVESPETFIK
ncbi:MAG: hypothetical protein QNJ72_18205 [Pleurocapsa sp. MO_226.B13]|nr:hypothetical protein [Pleurocapsa sp. MO_226.B13]